MVCYSSGASTPHASEAEATRHGKYSNLDSAIPPSQIAIQVRCVSHWVHTAVQVLLLYDRAIIQCDCAVVLYTCIRGTSCLVVHLRSSIKPVDPMRNRMTGVAGQGACFLAALLMARMRLSLHAGFFVQQVCAELSADAGTGTWTDASFGATAKPLCAPAIVLRGKRFMVLLL